MAIKKIQTLFTTADEDRGRALVVAYNPEVPELLFESRVVVGPGHSDQVDQVAVAPVELAEIVQAFRTEAGEPAFAPSRPPVPAALPAVAASLVFERGDLDADSSLTVRHAAATDEFLFDVYLPGGVGPQGRVVMSAAGAATLATAIVTRLAETQRPGEKPAVEKSAMSRIERRAEAQLPAVKPANAAGDRTYYGVAAAAAVAEAVGLGFGAGADLVATYFNAKKGRLRRKPRKGGLKDRRLKLLLDEALRAAAVHEGAEALQAAARAVDRISKWAARCRRELESSARQRDDANAPR